MKDKKSAKISTLGSQLSSVVSVTLVLILLGSLALVFTGARNAIENVRSSMTLTVTVPAGLSDYDINPVKQALTKAPYCTKFTYTSAEEVLAAESQLLGDSAFMLLDENPYSAEFDVRLAPEYSNPDSVDKAVAAIKAIPVVEDVQAPVNVATDVDRSLGKVSLIIGCVALALLVISIVLINNTVSLSIYGRRFIIHTMTLVGAKRSFIRAPFVKAGASCGLIAGIVADAILGGLYAYVLSAEPELAANVTTFQMSVIFTGLVLSGVLICALTAYFAATRYLNKRYDQLFKK